MFNLKKILLCTAFIACSFAGNDNFQNRELEEAQEFINEFKNNHPEVWDAIMWSEFLSSDRYQELDHNAQQKIERIANAKIKEAIDKDSETLEKLYEGQESFERIWDNDKNEETKNDK